MDIQKLFRITMYVLLAAYALGNVLFIFRAEVIMENGPVNPGPYSIYSSIDFFRVYHLWGIVLAGFTAYAFYKEHRNLFLISLFLLFVVFFYPKFSSDPVNDNKPKQNPTEQVEPTDSVTGARDTVR